VRRAYASAYVPSVEFTAEDLAANRQGLLSDAQRRFLDAVRAERDRGAWRTLRWGAVWCLGLLAVGAAIEARRGGWSGLAVPLAIAGGGMAVLLAVSWAAGRVLDRDLRRQRLSVADGVADVLVKESWDRSIGRFLRYEVRLRGGRGRQVFRLPDQRSIEHFTDGRACRVYYVESRPIPVVLSVEQTG
jgi:hypothetical protein